MTASAAPMRRVLVVSGGGFQGLGLLQSLQALDDVRAIVADVYADNVTRYLCADYETVPPLADADAFADALLAIVERHAVDAIFPATARELATLAELAPRLRAAGARVAISPPALLATLADKRATWDWLRAHALPVQPLIDPLAHDYAQPAFGRPRAGWGGVGTLILRSRADAQRQLTAIDPAALLWTPHVAEFDEFSADFAIAESAAVSPIVLRRRVRTSGGFAVISDSVDDAAIAALSARVAAALATAGARGIFNVQTIRPAGGDAFVSDLNPRFGTSAVHGLAEGVNLPGFYLDDGATDAAPQPRRGARTVRFLQTIALPRLSRRPRGVVFDLDDTLLDHKAWMAAKIAGAYDAVAHAWVGRDDFMLRALQLVDEGERRHLIDDIAAHFGWDEARRLALLDGYRGVRVAPTPLYADVEPVLASLRAAGFKLGLLTDNPPATQRAKIDAADALRALDAAVFARDSGAEKPAGTAFAAAADALGLAPEALCMVGDNYFRDGLGAVRSGYGCAFVVAREGGFLRPHAAIAAAAGPRAADVHRVDSLIVVRETLLAA